VKTRILSYRVFLFTTYSLGLRLGEGLYLQEGDIDAGYRAGFMSAVLKGNKCKSTKTIRAKDKFSFYKLRITPIPNIGKTEQNR